MSFATRTNNFKNVFKRKTAALGMLIVICMAIAATFSPSLAPHKPTKINFNQLFTPPFWMKGGSPSYLLGTDSLGRDIMSRIIYGSQKSLLISTLSTLLGVFIGVTLGLISGYYGGWIDSVISRIEEMFLAFPTILFAIAIVALLGGETFNMILVFAITHWVTIARVTRGEVLSAKRNEYVEASRTIGCKDVRIIILHILPNISASIIVIATLSLANIILAESSLSFLGFGVPPPAPTWGRMLSEGRQYLSNAWWIATFPGLAIMITVLGVNLLGDGLRDAYDPRLQHERR